MKTATPCPAIRWQLEKTQALLNQCRMLATGEGWSCGSNKVRAVVGMICLPRVLSGIMDKSEVSAPVLLASPCSAQVGVPAEHGVLTLGLRKHLARSAAFGVQDGFFPPLAPIVEIRVFFEVF